MKIPISKTTPPGSHKVDILVEDTLHLATIDVVERLYAIISPSKLYIEAKPGATVEKQIFVRNNGNVPLVFADPGPVILETNFLECRTIRDVVRKMDKKETSLEQILCLAAEKLEELYDEGSSLKVRLQGKPITIAPGESEKIDLVITLPSKLKRPNRYTGSYTFYNAAIVFSVVPNIKPANIKEPKFI